MIDLERSDRANGEVTTYYTCKPSWGFSKTANVVSTLGSEKDAIRQWLPPGIIALPAHVPHEKKLVRRSRHEELSRSDEVRGSVSGSNLRGAIPLSGCLLSLKNPLSAARPSLCQQTRDELASGVPRTCVFSLQFESKVCISDTPTPSSRWQLRPAVQIVQLPRPSCSLRSI